jgi:DMSO/TMAO reductase YedYZ heme-binding membrane subunit
LYSYPRALSKFKFFRAGVGGTLGRIRTGSSCISALLSQIHVPERQNIGYRAGDKQQARKDRQQKIAVVSSLVFLVLCLLSFYFAQSAIGVDEKAFVNVRRLLLAVLFFVVAHFVGYFTLVRGFGAVNVLREAL